MSTPLVEKLGSLGKGRAGKGSAGDALCYSLSSEWGWAGGKERVALLFV